MRAYLELTKPRISLLFAITGLAALVVEGSLSFGMWTPWILVLAIFLVGGSANAFNQYFERDIDAQMERTAQKRPLPLRKISPLAALSFSVGIGVVGLSLLFYFANGSILAFLLGLFTILFYSFYYTLWLKPRTSYNIVMGGAAGAMGPLIGWAAVTGTVGWEAWVMFLIIFFWTPPHFWALALYHKEDYEKVSLPMLPLVKGDEETRKQIFYYSLVLVPISLSLFLSHALSLFYVLSALGLGIFFVWFSFRLYSEKTLLLARRLFGYSIAYLMLLFLVMIVDGLV
ncbi:MAG: protoheme IX farnesyltransferase [Deltaproteobacteria bacterium]|nr:protoheme IX farnesyltransferase [Deltaproteobacteria bacterium]